MSTLSLPLTLYPCGVQGELYAPIVIGTTSLKALIDTGSGGLLTVQNVPNTVTYKKRPQVNTITLPNIPLGLNCSLQCTDQNNSACFFSQDKTCELHFGTGDLTYSPVLESITLGSVQHPAFFMALADSEQNFPFPIACIMGISHYKYADDSPLGSLCSKNSTAHGVLINQTTTTFQLFQHLGGGNCLIDTQTIRIASDNKDTTLSFAVPVPTHVPKVPMITNMFPFYAITLNDFQVGAVKKEFTTTQVVILDSGTSSGGSLAPEVYDFFASVLVRYTNGLSGLSINDAQVQGVNPDKLSAFPPIAFTWGGFQHVMSPTMYMISETCGKPNFINVFSRGTDNISVLGNVCFQQLAITFDLLHDEVYFERLGGPGVIDVNYPSPPASGVSMTMADSLQAGDSVSLPAPLVRVGIPGTVVKKMASTPLTNPNVFGTELAGNQCCLYDVGTQKNTDVGSLSVDVPAKPAKMSQPALWSDRNIVVLSLAVIVLVIGLWALAKYVMLSKKQKSSTL